MLNIDFTFRILSIFNISAPTFGVWTMFGDNRIVSYRLHEALAPSSGCF
jgi:hypothetical protein